MFSYLGWSILGRSSEFDRFEFEDTTTEVFAHLFFAVFLVIGVILLINMLIALLSHAFQRTQVRNKIDHGIKMMDYILSYRRLVGARPLSQAMLVLFLRQCLLLFLRIRSAHIGITWMVCETGLSWYLLIQMYSCAVSDCTRKADLIK